MSDNTQSSALLTSRRIRLTSDIARLKDVADDMAIALADRYERFTHAVPQDLLDAITIPDFSAVSLAAIQEPLARYEGELATINLALINKHGEAA